MEYLPHCINITIPDPKAAMFDWVVFNGENFSTFDPKPQHIASERYVLCLDDDTAPWQRGPKIVIPGFLQGYHWYSYAGPETWDELNYDAVVWARNATGFKQAIEAMGTPWKLSMDYVLNGSSENGLELAEWYVHQVQQGRLDMPVQANAHTGHGGKATEIMSVLSHSSQSL